MKEHVFAHMKTTPKCYRFQEVLIETGEILDKGDPRAQCNFGCIYLPKDNFQKEPKLLKLTIEADYHEKD